MRQLFRRLADTSRGSSLSNRMRRRRFERFRALLEGVPRPVWVLDVGGTPSFWDHMQLPAHDDVNVVVLNRHAAPGGTTEIESVAGDATNLSQYDDGAFDVVFSNSVIEHVGDLAAQRRMADEVRRAGERYWVQTPCRWFPIEPHFLFPFFGALPLRARAWLVRRFDLGWRHKEPDPEAALRVAQSVRLLRQRELRDLFADGQIERERFLGVTKSWIVLGGWDRPARPTTPPRPVHPVQVDGETPVTISER
jgi:hypothetical protein